MAGMFGHFMAGCFEFVVFYLLLARATTWFDKLKDWNYMYLGLVVMFTGGIAGLIPDLAGYYIDDHNWDSAHYITSTLLGFHYPIDALYAYYGIADFSIVGLIVELMIAILCITGILAVWGLSDAAVENAKQTMPAKYHEPDLTYSVHRAIKHIATRRRPSGG